jgi:hypothetical protein
VGGAVKELILRILRILLPGIDFLLSLVVYPAAGVMKLLRLVGVERLPCCRKVLVRVGIFPIRDHYYEPLFNEARLRAAGRPKRELAGICWNVAEQLGILRSFDAGEELLDIPTAKRDDTTFYLNNGAFESGDAEYLYNMIRLKKPGRIFEVGSGNSTLVAARAVRANREQDRGYRCQHVCIEPYEMPWLEKVGVTVVREKVESIPLDYFLELEENDLLFIDSSHIIRPQGDVLFEYLEILPVLKPGVIVHVHDIFSPSDYPNLCQGLGMFWNEQYLLEAFLMSNSQWKVIGALNYLQHNYYEELKEKCIFLTPEREPGSFYLQKKFPSAVADLR